MVTWIIWLQSEYYENVVFFDLNFSISARQKSKLRTKIMVDSMRSNAKQNSERAMVLLEIRVINVWGTEKKFDSAKCKEYLGQKPSFRSCHGIPINN